MPRVHPRFALLSLPCQLPSFVLDARKTTRFMAERDGYGNPYGSPHGAPTGPPMGYLGSYYAQPPYAVPAPPSAPPGYAPYAGAGVGYGGPIQGWTQDGMPLSAGGPYASYAPYGAMPPGMYPYSYPQYPTAGQWQLCAMPASAVGPGGESYTPAPNSNERMLGQHPVYAVPAGCTPWQPPGVGAPQPFDGSLLYPSYGTSGDTAAPAAPAKPSGRQRGSAAVGEQHKGAMAALPASSSKRPRAEAPAGAAGARETKAARKLRLKPSGTATLQVRRCVQPCCRLPPLDPSRRGVYHQTESCVSSRVRSGATWGTPRRWSIPRVSCAGFIVSSLLAADPQPAAGQTVHVPLLRIHVLRLLVSRDSRAHAHPRAALPVPQLPVCCGTKTPGVSRSASRGPPLARRCHAALCCRLGPCPHFSSTLFFPFFRPTRVVVAATQRRISSRLSCICAVAVTSSAMERHCRAVGRSPCWKPAAPRANHAHHKASCMIRWIWDKRVQVARPLARPPRQPSRFVKPHVNLVLVVFEASVVPAV